MKQLAITITAVTALGACAPIDQPPIGGGRSSDAQACFRGDRVDNFRVADRSTVYVRSREGNVFRLDAASCFDAGTTSIGVSPYMSTSERICDGDQARVQVGRNSAVPLTCIARVSGLVVDSSVSGLPSRG